MLLVQWAYRGTCVVLRFGYVRDVYFGLRGRNTVGAPDETDYGKVSQIALKSMARLCSGADERGAASMY